jgi:hypothetical protein
LANPSPRGKSDCDMFSIYTQFEQVSAGLLEQKEIDFPDR